VWALAWCLSVAAIVASPWVGFSPELGGFLAGLALANVSAHLQISSRIRPLRDFFLTLFFVSLGAGVTAIGFNGGWGIALALSGFVLIIKPLIVMTILLAQGYIGRVALMTAISLAQVSEFSLLIAALAVRTNQAPPEILAIMGLVGLITMIASNYGIMWSNKIYKFIAKFIPKRENKNLNKPTSGHIILFGHNRIGGILRPVLLSLGKPLVIVDFDPEVISRLNGSNENLEAIYGDISDDSIYDDLLLSKAEMIISTVSDCEDNLLLLEYLNKFKNKPLVIVIALSTIDAGLLYQKGADLVVVPHSMGGEYLANLFENRGLNRDYIVKRGIAHAKSL
ncbi:MAG: NAD-binding protein, partial [Patescibacteria group bacterium]